MNFNYMQAMQKQENPEGDLGRALFRVNQLEAEVARLNENVNKLNKALEQMRQLLGRHGDSLSLSAYGEDCVDGFENDGNRNYHVEAPELAAWMRSRAAKQENR